LNPNTRYYYRIRATNDAGDSAPSNVASAVTPVPPATPTNARVTLDSTNQVNLAWNDNSSNEDGFKVLRKASTASQFSEIANLPPNSTSYNDAGVTPGTRYDYHVQAYNIAGYSDFTGVTVTTPALAPTNLSATGGA